MTDKLFSLDIIDVASPCTADWEKMRGTDKVRHCGQCDLNVYHLSNMSRDEAEALVREHEGRICVRFYRRADGTVLTRDCPVGLQAIRRQLARLVAGMAAMIAFLATCLFCRRGDKDEGLPNPDIFARPIVKSSQFARLQNWNFPRGCAPLERLAVWLDPEVQTRGKKPIATMGK